MSVITLPRLKEKLYGDNPVAQLMQIVEEMGELSERIGQLTNMTGKRKEVPKNITDLVIEEAFDVAQAAVGVVFSLLQDTAPANNKHWDKMIERGYLE